MSGLLLHSPANIAVRSGAEKTRVRGRVSLSGEGPWNCPAIFQDLPAHARSLNAPNAESAFIFLNGQNASTDVACGTYGSAMPVALHSKQPSVSRRHSLALKGSKRRFSRPHGPKAQIRPRFFTEYCATGDPAPGYSPGHGQPPKPYFVGSPVDDGPEGRRCACDRHESYYRLCLHLHGSRRRRDPALILRRPPHVDRQHSVALRLHAAICRTAAAMDALR